MNKYRVNSLEKGLKKGPKNDLMNGLEHGLSSPSLKSSMSDSLSWLEGVQVKRSLDCSSAFFTASLTTVLSAVLFFWSVLCVGTVGTFTVLGGLGFGVISGSIAHAAPVPGACRVCGVVSKKQCTSCKEVHYCSREHQAKDWPTHKPFCNALSALRKQTKVFLQPKGQAAVKVEVRASAGDSGLYATQALDPGEIVALYWGIPTKELSLNYWHPTSAPFGSGNVIGERSAFILDRPYLAAQYANDGYMPKATGQFLLSVDSDSNGHVSESHRNRIYKAIYDYARMHLWPTTWGPSAVFREHLGGVAYVVPLQPISAGQELTVSYGAQYWLQAAAAPLFLRGYASEAFELYIGLSDYARSRCELEGEQEVCTTLSQMLGLAWMPPEAREGIKQGYPGLHGPLIQSFSGLFGSIPGLRVVIGAENGVDRFSRMCRSLFEMGHPLGRDYTRSDWVGLTANALNSFVSESGALAMKKLLDEVRLRPKGEFYSAQGAMVSHPLVLEFLETQGGLMAIDLSKEYTSSGWPVPLSAATFKARVLESLSIL